MLDAIRDIKVGEGVHPTLSIGVGKDADTMAELYKNANLSVEMALSRGGDQAVVRGKVDFAFYGGRAKTTEKRTKVKSRVMANALSELVADATEIYIMATALRTWTPWAPRRAFAAPPGTGASGPRSSLTWSAMPPRPC